MTGPAPFPTDWLPAARPVGDLDLALLLVNSYDLLEEPPDRLHDLTWLSAAFGAAGHAELAMQLRPDDVAPLRSLREVLRAAFALDDATQVAAVLNPLLRASPAPLLTAMVGSPDRVRLETGAGLEGYAALAARLPAAAAAYVAEHGTRRLGTCHSDPCRCAFVDRTRGRTRRYCCDYCNDRAAARSYRRRRSQQ